MWFSKYSITNIISLKKLIKKYRVTYDSIDQIFMVHREDLEKPNMEFNRHESVLHYYNPTDKVVVLINTVSKLVYTTVKYFRWIFQSQQIIDCPVTVQDIDTAHTIWGKIIVALKGKTTRKETIHLAGEIVKTPKELVKPHK